MNISKNLFSCIPQNFTYVILLLLSFMFLFYYLCYFNKMLFGRIDIFITSYPRIWCICVTILYLSIFLIVEVQLLLAVISDGFFPVFIYHCYHRGKTICSYNFIWYPAPFQIALWMLVVAVFSMYKIICLAKKATLPFPCSIHSDCFIFHSVG